MQFSNGHYKIMMTSDGIWMLSARATASNLPQGRKSYDLSSSMHDFSSSPSSMTFIAFSVTTPHSISTGVVPTHSVTFFVHCHWRNVHNVYTVRDHGIPPRPVVVPVPMLRHQTEDGHPPSRHFEYTVFYGCCVGGRRGSDFVDQLYGERGCHRHSP